jgi:hypothetical protein
MGHIQFTTSLIMVALFSIAVVSFAINFAIDNDSEISLQDDASFVTLNEIQQDNVTEFFDDANDSMAALILSTLDQGDETTVSGGQFKGSVSSTLSVATNAVRVGYKNIFGSDNGFGIFLTVLIGLLTYIGAAYVYKAWIGRNPD